MRRIHLRNHANVEKLIRQLWEKHAQGDRHGYKDWMGETGFGDAVCSLIDDINNGKLVLPKDK